MLDPGRAVERNIIACMLSDATCMEKVLLPSQAFESQELQIVYSVISELKLLGYESITLNTLKNHFDSRRDFQVTLQEHGGLAFLNNLANKPDLPNFDLHLDALTKRFNVSVARNHILMAADAIKGGQYETPEQVYSVLDECLLSDDVGSKTEVFRTIDMNNDWLEQQADLFDAGAFESVGHPVVQSGLLEAFDGRFLHGSLIVWTGTTNIGKSLLCTMLTDVQGIRLNIPTLLLDNEMTSKEFQCRLLSRLSRVPIRSLLDGEAYRRGSKYFDQLRYAIGLLHNSPVEWRRMEDLSIERIEPVLRRFMRYYKDRPHKQLIVDGIKMSTDSDSYLQVGFFAQRLKTHIANRYADQGLVVHATCQLNRSGGSFAIKKNKDEHPTHENIALSKLIADNADDVCILAPALDAQGQFDKSRRKIFITKARNHSVLVGNEYINCMFEGGSCNLTPLGVVLSGMSVENEPEEDPQPVSVEESAKPDDEMF